MATRDSGSVAARRKKAAPMLSVDAPAADKNAAAYTFDEDGAFVEGNLSISRAGIVIANTGSALTAVVSHVPAPVPVPVTVTAPTPDRASVALEAMSPKPPSHVPLHQQAVEEEIRDIRFVDLRVIRQLGRGSGGVVQCVLYKPRRKLMAMKVIPLDVTDQVRKQILLELRTLYQAQSPNIVKFYGAFFTDGHIQICLELMDVGSLESLSKTIGPFPEPVLASVATQVLRGLVYLHKEKKLVHRDIKPSNILINSRGEVKITDFGVSGQLASSISSCVSWVGTVTYMSPERIQGQSYTVQSDIWSFGLSMVELALGHFPYHTEQQAAGDKAARRQSNPLAEEGTEGFGFWELLSLIVEQDTPDVPSSTYSPEFQRFCRSCLQKNPADRMSAVALLEHEFVGTYADRPVDMAAWVQPHIVRHEEDVAALAQPVLAAAGEVMGSPIPKHVINDTRVPPLSIGTPPTLPSSSSSSESIGALLAHDRSGSRETTSSHDRSSSRGEAGDRSSSRSSARDQPVTFTDGLALDDAIEASTRLSTKPERRSGSFLNRLMKPFSLGS